MTAFLAVLAVATTGAAIGLMFAFSYEAAIVWIGLVVATAHILRPWLAPSEQQGVSGQWLLNFMMWSMSLLLLLVATAIALSLAACRFGYFCPLPAKYVSIGTFSLLDEGEVDTSKPDAHVLAKAKKVARNTIWHMPGAAPLVVLVTTLDDYAVKPDGTINLTVDLLVGPSNQKLSLDDQYTLRTPAGWKTGGLVDRYAGKAAGLVADLKAQGIPISGDSIVLITTVTCLSKEVLDAGTLLLKTVVFDHVNHTFSESELAPLKIFEKAPEAKTVQVPPNEESKHDAKLCPTLTEKS